jgi:hypothetical protein
VTAVLDDVKGGPATPIPRQQRGRDTRQPAAAHARGEEWNEVLDTDLTSLYRLCKARCAA